MMEAALEGLTRPDGSRPLLIAVTQLTSTSQARMQEELLIDRPLPEVVMHYAQLAKEAGLDGVVCSPQEAGKVHAACGEDFLTVTPGVRFAGGEVGDQVRVMTPAQGPGDWRRLHCGWPPHYPGKRSRSGLHPLPERICGRIRKRRRK